MAMRCAVDLLQFNYPDRQSRVQSSASRAEHVAPDGFTVAADGAAMDRRKARSTLAPSAKFWSPAWKTKLRRQLLVWYARHRRDLPWRRTSDPYQIWISEIMLQQTQVGTVVPYFERFVAAFPNLHALANAAEHDVLKRWEGLGYYRRARQLHLAAKVVVGQHGGHLPRDPALLAGLPGIGRYTAGAIASIAFDVRTPILEANTRRLLQRLCAQRKTAGILTDNQLWDQAEKLLPRGKAGAFNQALMELGSLICKPAEPLCHLCPVSGLCPTRRLGLANRPLPTNRAPIESVREACVIVGRGNRVLIRQCMSPDRWAGLWDFLRFPLATLDGAVLEKELRQRTLELTGLRIANLQRRTTIKHSVTRFRITLECYIATASVSRLPKAGINLRWIDIAELVQYPLSRPARRIAELLAEQNPV